MYEIKRHNIQNVDIVVVRYFGGTLLGKGGLIRAYGKAVGLALYGFVSNEKQEGNT